MSGTFWLETIGVKIIADASIYKKEIAAATADVVAATTNVKAYSEDMAAHIKRANEQTIKSFEGVAQAGHKSALVLKSAKAAVVSEADKMKQALAIYNEGAPTKLAGLEKQFADARESIGNLRETTDRLVEIKTAAADSAAQMQVLGTAADAAALGIGILNIDAGLGIASVNRIAQACPEAAAGLGVFAASVTATTYALQGQEGVTNLVANSTELFAMLLKGASFGLADYTEQTKIAKQAEQELAQAQTSAAGMSQQIIEERTKLMRGLVEQVQALHDVSDSAEAAFVKNYVNELHASGTYGGKLDSENLRAHQTFEAERISRLLTEYKQEADAIGRTREELIGLAMDRDHASDAARREFEALQKLAAFRREQVEAERAAKEEARRADSEAKRHAETLTREGERVTESVKTAAEKQADYLKHLRELRDANAIDESTYNRAVVKAMSADEDPGTKHRKTRVDAGGAEPGGSLSLPEFKTPKQLRNFQNATRNMLASGAFNSPIGGLPSPLATMVIAARQQAAAMRESAKFRRAGSPGKEDSGTSDFPINAEAIMPYQRPIRMPTPEEIAAGHRGRRIGSFPLEEGESENFTTPDLRMGPVPMPHLVTNGPESKVGTATDKLVAALEKNNELLTENNKTMEKSDKLEIVAADF